MLSICAYEHAVSAVREKDESLVPICGLLEFCWSPMTISYPICLAAVSYVAWHFGINPEHDPVLGVFGLTSVINT